MNGDDVGTTADLCAPKAFPGAKADVLPNRAASEMMVAAMDFILILVVVEKKIRCRDTSRGYEITCLCQ